MNWNDKNRDFAEWMIVKLLDHKPFAFVFNAGETGSLYQIAKEMKESDLVDQLEGRVKNGTGVSIMVNQDKADKLYHMLSSYLNRGK